MPYRFLLIFFPLGFKGVFIGTSYCTLCNIYSRYMSYLLFFPTGVFIRKYTRHIYCSLNSSVRFFPFLRFSSYEFSWRQQSLYVVSFSSYFSHRVLRSFNNILNTTLIFFPSGFWGRYYQDIKIKDIIKSYKYVNKKILKIIQGT
jgi:hypothetical protein